MSSVEVQCPKILIEKDLTVKVGFFVMDAEFESRYERWSTQVCIPMTPETIRVVFYEGVDGVCTNGYSREGCGLSLELTTEGEPRLICPQSCEYYVI